MKAPDFVVDIGNSQIKWGRCQDGKVAEFRSLPSADETTWELLLDEWQIAPRSTWILAGVQPRTRQALHDWLLKRAFHVDVIDSYRKLPLQMSVEKPEKVGLDRLLNAVAVNRRRSPGHSAIAIDAGTAVTVDYVDSQGVFQGGAIFPGMQLMARALHQYTALLPSVDIVGRIDPPGKWTVPAMQAGIFHAVLGGVESLVARLKNREPCDIFCGGGDSERLTPHFSFACQSWPTMTLEGIRCSAEALA